MRATCCKECSDARDKDRSPDPADKVPCADYTADVGESCRKWFLKKPMMASEAQTCAKETAGESGDAAAPADAPAGEASAGDAKK